MPMPTARPVSVQRLARPGLIGLLLLGLALSAQAQWKWKDASGKIQYSDLPPPSGTPDKDILQRPTPPRLQIQVVPSGGAASVPESPARAASTPSRAELEQQARQKQQEQEALAKAKEEERRIAAQRRDNCARAQDNLKLIESGVRLGRPNERGENIPMDDKQRADELQRTRAVIASECR
ncbi:DUF4124 domain-containing protein [Roseateles violae]|uniref:DUF4124 domain-containing protein n=1 Tax=Roseateles violae TaxID=3058042 RepID=A0ABT8DXE8_9BURK|nr:DUF4124 domain-containing protein [Pelomonas sp. PFR6]MDN3922080.1 DUF4124 domain-containing protein [Pelomonas sp. PFR6]